MYLTVSHITWDMELFLKALDEAYAVNPVDKFTKPREIRRTRAS